MGLDHCLQLWNFFSKEKRIEAWVHQMEKYEFRKNLKPPRVMNRANLYSYIPSQAIVEYGFRATDRLNKEREQKGLDHLPRDYAYQQFLMLDEQDALQIQKDVWGVDDPNVTPN